jgi:adenylate cyclase
LEAAQIEYQRAMELFQQYEHDSDDALDAVIGLALVKVQRRKGRQALQYAAQIQKILVEQGQISGRMKRKSMMSLYLVFQSVEDPTATSWLSDAHAHLQSVVEKFQDEGLRMSFLENHPYNRDILTAWEKENPSEIGS